MLLTHIFAQTLPYRDLEVLTNFGDFGGEDNSITPGDAPMFSAQIWSEDFSAGTVSDSDKGTFIHEFTHVWQYYHGITKLSVIWLALRHLGDYRNAYPYDLSDEDDLTDYNVEQQAAIIEDYWRITRSLSPLNNNGIDKKLSSYQQFVNQVKGAGAPHAPLIPEMRFRH